MDGKSNIRRPPSVTSRSVQRLIISCAVVGSQILIPAAGLQTGEAKQLSPVTLFHKQIGASSATGRVLLGTTNRFLYMFFARNGNYQYAAGDKLDRTTIWRGAKYVVPDDVLSGPFAYVLDGIIGLGDNIYVRDGKNTYRYPSLKDGSLGKPVPQFYSLQDAHTNAANGCFYRFGGHRARSWYSVSRTYTNGNIARPTRKWLEDSQMLARDSNFEYASMQAGFADNKFFTPSGVLRLDATGRPTSWSANAPISDRLDIYPEKILALPHAVYVLLRANSENGFRVVCGYPAEDGTIYEWKEQIALRSPNQAEADWVRHGKTLYVVYRSYDKSVKNAATQNYENVSMLTMLSLLLPPEQSAEDTSLGNQCISTEEEPVIKNESEINIMTYNQDESAIYAWDGKQKAMLRATEEGKSWSFGGLNFGPRYVTNNNEGLLLDIKRLPKAKRWLLAFSFGLFTSDYKFSQLQRLGSDETRYNGPPYNNYIAVSPENEEVLLVARGKDVYRSGNAGKNWVPRAKGLPLDTFPNPVWTFVQFLPWSKDFAITTGLGGYPVYMTTDLGENWYSLTTWLKDNAFVGSFFDHDFSKSASQHHDQRVCFGQQGEIWIVMLSFTYGRPIVVAINVDTRNRTASAYSIEGGSQLDNSTHVNCCGLTREGISIGTNRGIFLIDAANGKLARTLDDKVYSFLQDTALGGAILAGATGRIWQSSDGARTWTLLAGFPRDEQGH
ncbi:MAG: hypothetical protein HZB55_18855 [Deltaproteobacteria bacterium]|nr:hypothetical protein [Deltaproteobacteria bacterium]